MLLLLLGVFACSTSVVLIKLCRVDPTLLTAMRLAIAAAVLSPLMLIDWKKHRSAMTWRHVRDSAVPGLALAAHFITWMIGVRMTEVINASLIVNTAPVVMPLFLWAMVGERVTRWELMATAVAAAGLLILIASDFRYNPASFDGDMICFGSMLLFATYITLAKKHRHHPTVWLYLTPLYASAALFAALAAPVTTRQWSFDWSRELPYVFAIALVPTVIGHTLLNNAMRYLRGQVVMLVNLLQFVFAGAMGYLVLGEAPARQLLSGGRPGRGGGGDDCGAPAGRRRGRDRLGIRRRVQSLTRAASRERQRPVPSETRTPMGVNAPAAS